MVTAGDVHSGGVPAIVLRRCALPVVVVGGVGVALADRTAGANAVFAAIFAVVVYGTLVAVPIQVLYRHVRLRPPGVVLFATTVLAIVATVWCVPLARDQFTGHPSYLVGLRTAFGKPPLAAGAVEPWQMAALGCGAVVVVGCVALAVLTWRLQRRSRGRAVDPVVAGSILATFATLPAPDGGTSVTRPSAPR